MRVALAALLFSEPDVLLLDEPSSGIAQRETEALVPALRGEHVLSDGDFLRIGRQLFRFESMMMSHTINGRAYDMDRVDEHVPFGATEIWTFVNEGQFPHPIHLHATHFQLLGRSGGRDVGGQTRSTRSSCAG